MLRCSSTPSTVIFYRLLSPTWGRPQDRDWLKERMIRAKRGVGGSVSGPANPEARALLLDTPGVDTPCTQRLAGLASPPTFTVE